MAQQIISIHAPKAQRPQTMNEFGYFLAGLIDGNGHIHQDGSFNINSSRKRRECSILYKKKQSVMGK